MAKTLTSTKLQGLKATGKDYRLSDGNGLYIKINKSGTKSWQFRFKGKWLGLGSFPELSLKQARDEAFKYSQMLVSGKDPKQEREKAKHNDDNLFINISEESFKNRHPSNIGGWKDEKAYKRNYSIYTRIILPELKTFNISDIEPYQISNILEKYTPSNQRKIKALLNMIFNYAIGKGIIKYNIVHGIQVAKESPKGFEFISPIEDRYNFSLLLNDIDAYKGQYNTLMALKLAVLVGFRPSNIVEMKWEDIDGIKQDGQTINFVNIQANSMKMGRDFRQPLSRQAYKILMDIKQCNGDYEYIFSSQNKKGEHITIASLSKGLKDSLAYNGIDKPKQHTHGFRKSVRTYLSTIRSKHNWSDDSIRMILSHSKENAIDNIYDKNDFLLERSQMLQLWADYVDEVKANSNVINMEVS